MRNRLIILATLAIAFIVYLVIQWGSNGGGGSDQADEITFPIVELNKRIALELMEVHNESITLRLKNISSDPILFTENYNLQIFMLRENILFPFPGKVHVEFQSGDGDQLLQANGSEGSTRLMVVRFEESPYNLLDGGILSFSVFGFVNSDGNQPTQAVLHFP